MYSDNEIKKYLDILHKYKSGESSGGATHCCNPENYFEYFGRWICNECGNIRGYIKVNDLKDYYDRLYFQKKSVYHRKYYFYKKVNNIGKLINLNDEEKSILYDRLLLLDVNIIKKINKDFNRKRMINIDFIIKKILEEMGCEKYEYINIKNNYNILKIYEEWWSKYKEAIL